MSQSNKSFSGVGQFIIGLLGNIMMLFLILTLLAPLEGAVGSALSFGAFVAWSIFSPRLAGKYVGWNLAYGAVAGSILYVLLLVGSLEGL